MSPFDPTLSWSTPFDAPLVPRLPIRMRHTEILTIIYRTEAAAADAIIPHPLELADDLVILQIYKMHDAEWFGVYTESAVQLPVRLPDGRRSVYSPYLVLESDGAVAAGRELYGQPKKAGAVELAPDGDLLIGRVRRNGIDIVTATMCWKQQHGDGGELERLVPGSATNVNLRILPTSGGDVSRDLVLRTFEDVTVHEAWTGSATAEVRPHAQVPVHKLPVLETVAGLHRVVDLSLGLPEVIHRYP